MQTQTNLWTDANLEAYSENNEFMFLCQYDLDEEQRIAIAYLDFTIKSSAMFLYFCDAIFGDYFSSKVVVYLLQILVRDSRVFLLSRNHAQKREKSFCSPRPLVDHGLDVNATNERT